MTGSPVVELNRAVAVGMADGPAAGLALLAGLEAGGALGGYYLLAATRADFLRRLGRNEEAAVAYEEAAALAGTGPERRFLNARQSALGPHPSPAQLCHSRTHLSLLQRGIRWK